MYKNSLDIGVFLFNFYKGFMLHAAYSSITNTCTCIFPVHFYVSIYVWSSNLNHYHSFNKSTVLTPMVSAFYASANVNGLTLW